MYKVEIFQTDNSYYSYKMEKKQVDLLEKKINSGYCKYLNFIEDNSSMLFIPKATILKIVITKVGA